MDSARSAENAVVRLRRWFRFGLALGAFGITLCVIIGFLGSLWWGFDLLSHFRLQYCICLILIALGSLIAGTRRGAVFSSICFVLLGSTLLPYLPLKGRSDAAAGFKTLSFNVHTANPERSRVIDLIRSSAADVVVLYEVDISWMRSLSSLQDVYSTAASLPREDNFGIVLLSRGLVLDAEVMEFGSAGVPSIVARVQDPRFAGLLVATHPVPPVGQEGSRLRDEQISAIADFLRKNGRTDTLVVGDLNASPWSHAFRLLTAVGLRDARRGYGISPTWMRSLPWIAIPIDHALVGEAVEVVDYEMLDSAGSDHNGVLVTVQKKS